MGKKQQHKSFVKWALSIVAIIIIINVPILLFFVGGCITSYLLLQFNTKTQKTVQKKAISTLR